MRTSKPKHHKKLQWRERESSSSSSISSSRKKVGISAYFLMLESES
jgi:hypothetical protein